MKAKKIISTILTIAMLLAIVSVSVSAAPLTFGDSATYTITSVAEINPDNFNIKVEVDESKILATDGGSIEYTTVVTSAVVDGIDYYVDPEAFLDIFVQNVGDEAETKRLIGMLMNVFEQREIPTDDGDMYVSFWHPGDDYFIYTQEEMDEYINQGQGLKMGGM